MNKTKDCPHLIDDSNGIYKKGKCNITNDICGLVRYCTTKNKIVSSNLYLTGGCNIENSYEKGVAQ